LSTQTSAKLHNLATGEFTMDSNNPQSERRNTETDPDSFPGDVTIEFMGGHIVRISSGTSIIIGSGADANCRVEHSSVAPKHVRIDNRAIPSGYDASHPYCRMVWVADIGGAAVGEDLFGPRSRTGVVTDLEAGLVMPLELGEAAPLRQGTIVLLGEIQFRVLSEGQG
jgi:hypothetical protein